jgi:hypothetical protein
MTTASPPSARLVFKRAFVKYYLELNSKAIADPSEAFATCRAYLRLLRDQLGGEEFMRRLDEETIGLAGQLEQDMRQRFRERSPQLHYEDLEERLRECFEHGLARLDLVSTRLPVQ